MNAAMKRIALTAMAVSLFAPVMNIQAETPKKEFKEHHPRRAEVNARVHNQRRLLRNQLKSGKITQQQYNDQMATLKNVKTQEHADVSANGGSLTKGQDKALNQELNQNREAIEDNSQAAH